MRGTDYMLDPIVHPGGIRDEYHGERAATRRGRMRARPDLLAQLLKSSSGARSSSLRRGSCTPGCRENFKETREAYEKITDGAR